MVVVKTLGTKAQLSELSAKAEQSLQLGNIVRDLVASNLTANQPDTRPCLQCGGTAPVSEFQWVKPKNGDPKYKACGDCAAGKTKTKAISSMAFAFAAIVN